MPALDNQPQPSKSDAELGAATCWAFCKAGYARRALVRRVMRMRAVSSFLPLLGRMRFGFVCLTDSPIHRTVRDPSLASSRLPKMAGSADGQRPFSLRRVRFWPLRQRTGLLFRGGRQQAKSHLGPSAKWRERESKDPGAGVKCFSEGGSVVGQVVGSGAVRGTHHHTGLATLQDKSTRPSHALAAGTLDRTISETPRATHMLRRLCARRPMGAAQASALRP
jgi:hypothetical protein